MEEVNEEEEEERGKTFQVGNFFLHCVNVYQAGS